MVGRRSQAVQMARHVTQGIGTAYKLAAKTISCWPRVTTNAKIGNFRVAPASSQKEAKAPAATSNGVALTVTLIRTRNGRATFMRPQGAGFLTTAEGHYGTASASRRGIISVP